MNVDSRCLITAAIGQIKTVSLWEENWPSPLPFTCLIDLDDIPITLILMIEALNIIKIDINLDLQSSKHFVEKKYICCLIGIMIFICFSRFRLACSIQFHDVIKQSKLQLCLSCSHNTQLCVNVNVRKRYDASAFKFIVHI